MVELVVVIVILAVTATMVLPRVTGAANLTLLRESARSMALSARYAREYAVLHRCSTRLAIDAAQRRYGLLCQPDPEHDPGQFAPLPNTLGRPSTLEATLHFAWIRIEPRSPGRKPADGDVIEFDPAGRSDAAVVQIADKRRTFSLTFAPTNGQVRVVESAVEELPNDRLDIDAR